MEQVIQDDAKVEFHHAAMVKRLAKPGKAIQDSMSASQMHCLHMVIGVSGEAGELLEALMANYNDTAAEELGDIEFYMQGLRSELDIDRDDTLGADPVGSRYTDPGVGIVIEAAALLDSVKKFTVYQKSLDLSEVRKRLGHLEYYMARVRGDLDTPRKAILQGNIKKLSKRYAAGYTDKAAQERADKAPGA